MCTSFVTGCYLKYRGWGSQITFVVYCQKLSAKVLLFHFQSFYRICSFKKCAVNDGLGCELHLGTI